MAKAVAKSKKTVAKSKPSAKAKAAPPPSARKALKKAPAKPAAKPALKAQVEKALDHVGRIAGKAFGDSRNPLLVSVRSGGRASMPGMMDTVLNLGLNDKTVEALAELSGDRRFAYDSYRRFITMYSD